MELGSSSLYLLSGGTSEAALRRHFYAAGSRFVVMVLSSIVNVLSYATALWLRRSILLVAIILNVRCRVRVTNRWPYRLRAGKYSKRTPFKSRSCRMGSPEVPSQYRSNHYYLLKCFHSLTAFYSWLPSVLSVLSQCTSEICLSFEYFVDQPIHLQSASKSGIWSVFVSSEI